jgi:hypothetical protein
MIRAISYGGGVQSTALLVLAARGDIDYPLALFANVGDDSEHPATLAYVRDVAAPFAERHGIELAELRARPRGKPTTLLQTLMREGSRSVDIPAWMEGAGAPGRRTCTKDFKISRIAAWLKMLGATADDPATCALGISLDEWQRMRSESGFAFQRLTYPLIDAQLDRAACVALIERAGLPVPPKSSCWFCPYRPLRYWQEMKRDDPERFGQAVNLERLLSERHAGLTRANGDGRGAVFLSPTLRPLGDAVGTAEQLDLFDAASCDIGGYCHA